MEATRQAPALPSSAMTEEPEDTKAPESADRFRARDREGGSLKDVRTVDQRSIDYALRSGFAGGIAGCAVGGSGYTSEALSLTSIFFFCFLGENCRGSA